MRLTASTETGSRSGTPASMSRQGVTDSRTSFSSFGGVSNPSSRPMSRESMTPSDMRQRGADSVMSITSAHRESGDWDAESYARMQEVNTTSSFITPNATPERSIFDMVRSYVTPPNHPLLVPVRRRDTIPSSVAPLMHISHSVPLPDRVATVGPDSMHMMSPLIDVKKETVQSAAAHATNPPSDEMANVIAVMKRLEAMSHLHSSMQAGATPSYYQLTARTNLEVTDSFNAVPVARCPLPRGAHDHFPFLPAHMVRTVKELPVGSHILLLRDEVTHQPKVLQCGCGLHMCQYQIQCRCEDTDCVWPIELHESRQFPSVQYVDHRDQYGNEAMEQ
jgi:hypothetical protein